MSRPLLALALAACLALPGSALASHMQSYTRLPEHDDLGRSDEPDHAGTAVLGPVVLDRVIDPTNTDGASAVPDSFWAPGAVLAPGCSDNAGRQPSGLCWLNGQVRFVGVAGMTGSAAPGLTRTKDTVVRFLDARQDVMVSAGAVRVLDVNHKVQDSPASGLLAQAGVGRFVAGPTEMWAWFGIWQDRNGNGVIDHEQNVGEPGSVSARNEFVWLGGCLDLNHAVRTRTPYCHQLPDARIAGFVWPGNHHASCGGGTIGGVDPVVGCSSVPADVPGLQAYCLAQEGVAEQAPRGVSDLAFDFVNVHGCGSSPEALEQDSGALYGDPLLENPTVKRPDFYYDDRTGEPDIEARQWLAGAGYPVYFYDSSLIATTTFVAVEGAPYAANANTVDLARAQFVDVDVDRSWSPLAENLVEATLKPVVQSVWLSNRELVVAAFNTGSAVARGKAADTSPVTGPLTAQMLDPGFAHEPNDPRDVEPGAAYAAFGPRTHEGFTNDYRGYALQPRGWLDAQGVRVMTDNLAWQLPEPSGDLLSQCLVCTAGPGVTSSTDVLAPRGPGQDQRSLDPGLYTWQGRIGLWHDLPQTRIEEHLDLLPSARFNFTRFTDPPDGWPGNVVNATGTFVYRGYGSESCDVQGQPGTHPYAWCHPTMDGSIADPSDYGTASGEWQGQCVGGQNLDTLWLVPAGNTWSVPAIVWRNLETAPPTDLSQVENWQGRTDDPNTPQNEAAMPLHLRCDDVLQGTFHASDFLLLPEGNLGLGITATAAGRVALLDGTQDDVQDVDVYVAAAPP